MKKRHGFVSNSSSSSFVVICQKVKPQSVVPKDIKSGKIMVIGEQLCEGTDFFILATPEMLEFAGANKFLAARPWFKVVYMSDSDIGSISITPDMVGNEVVVIEVDQHSTSDLNELKERYSK